MSVYTQSCDICQFILSRVTCQFILGPVTYVNLYCHMTCQYILCHVTYVSLYSVMWNMSVYTRSCYICQFHIPLLYVIHLEAVDVSPPLFILMCIIMKWVLPLVTFGVMNIWWATAFPFCSSCRTLDPKLVKGKLQRLSGRQLECYKYYIIHLVIVWHIYADNPISRRITNSEALWRVSDVSIERKFRMRSEVMLCNVYTGWFSNKGQYFGKWYPQSLWERNAIQTCV